MKLLHTADWHLGDRLGRIDRTPELRRGVERVAAYCEEHAVDVLIVAGDLFSELPRADGLREEVEHLQRTFEPFFRRGGTMIAVTGNHDHEGFCRTLRTAMGLAAPTVEAFGAVVPSGRLYLADEPSLLRLADPAGGFVQFVLMPYPQPAAYLVHEVHQKYGSLAEKKQFLQAAFAARLAEIRGDARFDASIPAVLVAHVSVGGGQAEYLFRVAPDEDIVCPGEAISDEFAYVALGHIHKPHHLPGRPNVRYPGGLARLDLGEANDRREVLLVDLNKPTQPTPLPIDADPIYSITVHEPASELPSIRERYPDCERALVNLEVNYAAGVDDLEVVLRTLDDIFPRWYDRSWTESSELGPGLAAGANPTRGFEEVVREYLDAELAHHEVGVRDAVAARLERLLHQLSKG